MIHTYSEFCFKMSLSFCYKQLIAVKYPVVVPCCSRQCRSIRDFGYHPQCSVGHTLWVMIILRRLDLLLLVHLRILHIYCPYLYGVKWNRDDCYYFKLPLDADTLVHSHCMKETDILVHSMCVEGGSSVRRDRWAESS